MPVAVPPHPGEPPAPGASDELWRRYLAQLGLHQAALIANMKSAGEAACAAATQAVADAQRAHTAAMMEVHRAPPSKPTREQLILERYRHQPQVTGLTDLQAVDLSVAAVDAFIKRFPGAVS